MFLLEAFPNLTGETVVYVESAALSQQFKSFSGEGQPDYTIATCPITVGYGERQVVKFNQYQGPLTAYIDKELRVVFIDVSLKNIYNEPLDIGYNQQMFMSVKLWQAISSQ